MYQKRTKKMQQKIIDEPYTLKMGNGRGAQRSGSSEADKAKLRQKDDELRILRSELAEAKREIQNMKSSLQNAERAVEQASNSTSNTASNFDLGQEYARLSKHRNALATILNDYDASTQRLKNAMGGVQQQVSYNTNAQYSAPVQQQSYSAPVQQQSSGASGVSTAKAVEVVLDVLAAKTGYETDMLEMDMDLETELGVDSIKRVEILSDVQAQLGIEAQDVAALGRTRTVGEVVDAMKAEILNAGGSSSAPVQQQQQQSYSAPVQQQSSGSSGVSTAKAVEVVLMF